MVFHLEKKNFSFFFRLFFNTNFLRASYYLTIPMIDININTIQWRTSMLTRINLDFWLLTMATTTTTSSWQYRIARSQNCLIKPRVYKYRPGLHSWGFLWEVDIIKVQRGYHVAIISTGKCNDGANVSFISRYMC